MVSFRQQHTYLVVDYCLRPVISRHCLHNTRLGTVVCTSVSFLLAWIDHLSQPPNSNLLNNFGMFRGATMISLWSYQITSPVWKKTIELNRLSYSTSNSNHESALSDTLNIIMATFYYAKANNDGQHHLLAIQWY